MAYVVFSFSIEADLLTAFLAGDRHARTELPREYHARLVMRIRQIAPDLDRLGLAEDVVQQMWWLLLAKRPGSFDPNRGTAETFIKLVMRNAVRDVRAMNRAPGHRSRPQRDATGAFVKQPEPISLSAPVPAVDGDICVEDVLPDCCDLLAEADDKLEARSWLHLAERTSPENILAALKLVYYRSINLSEVADHLGQHRSTLRRGIDRWAERQQLYVAQVGGLASIFDCRV